ncbi:thermonuclease family protein [Sphingomonas sp. XXL09]|uniref:thermonuclease family protein n=1 Tax=Sphingomonas sp. XXL09 TaxID=3457787 RepID=UPI00406BC80F
MPGSFRSSGDNLDAVAGCIVTDGDTIRCDGERIRLLGIDAPELPGHCRTGRNCAPGDGYASKASLAAAMVGTIHVNRVGEDRYGRTLALLSSDRGDLSCWQLRHGQAIYKTQWDDGRRVARICPKSARLAD